MAIVTIGIDLAKNIFAVHGVDATGKTVLVRRNVAQAKLLKLMASIPTMPHRHGSVFRPPTCLEI